MLYDAIVVGLGPGGSTAARQIAKAGLKVLGLEKETHPRVKPCGGGLTRRTLKSLDFSVDDLIKDEIYGGVFTFKYKDTLPIMCKDPFAFTSLRTEFDNRLFEKAVEAGVEALQDTKVTAIRELSDRVEVDAGGRTYAGKVLVGADGATGIVSRHVHPKIKRESIAAIEGEFPTPEHTVAPMKGVFYIDYGSFRFGYAWVFPKGPILNVGAAGINEKGSRVKQVYSEYGRLYDLPAETVKPLGHPIPLPLGAKVPLCKNRIFLVGDAAGLVNPFTGEGIYYAVESGRLAALTIAAHLDAPQAFGEYDTAVKQAFYDEFTWATRLMKIVSAFPKLVYKIIKDHQGVMGTYFALLSGELSYDETIRRLKNKMMLNLRRKLGIASAEPNAP